MFFSRFLPQEGSFFELFNAHAELIVKGGRELAALVNSLENEPGTIGAHSDAIDEIESAADTITHETVSLLHKTFNTPLDRDEIHQLISGMDDILDLIQDIAEAIYLYDVRKLTQEARHIADLSVSCCERVRSAVVLLNNMDNAPAILKLCKEIDQLETDADRSMRQGIARLFREESDVRQVLKLKELYELLELVTDRCEDVANVIEGIVLENS
jgi:predicted phosphate transport protein (TIGR00153 family)